jgi:hypothetical protein
VLLRLVLGDRIALRLDHLAECLMARRMQHARRIAACVRPSWVDVTRNGLRDLR